MVSIQDCKSQLRRHFEEAAEELTQEHAALRGVIDEHLRCIAERQRELIAKKIQDLDDSDEREMLIASETEAAQPQIGPAAEQIPFQEACQKASNFGPILEANVKAPADAVDCNTDVYDYGPNTALDDYDAFAPGQDQQIDYDPTLGVLGQAIPKNRANVELDRGNARLRRCIKFYDTASKEPTRTGRLADFVASSYFLAVTTFVIFFDQAVTIASTNHAMANRTSEKLQWVIALEWCFLVVYIAEIGCKLFVHHLFFFTNENANWNIFDLIIVLYSLVSTTGLNLSFLRSLRVLKLMKSLKALRFLTFVEDLHMMVDSLLGCFFKFLWSALLLIFLLYIFALLFVQQAAGYISDTLESGSQVNPSTLQEMDSLLGSVQEGIFTLFKCVTFGLSWAKFRETVSYTGQLSAVMLSFFQFFWMIAVMNIVTTVFLSRVIRLTQPSPRDQLRAKLQQNQADAGDLTELFKGFEGDAPSISKGELVKVASTCEVREFLALRGVEIKDEEDFSKTLIDMAAEHPRCDKSQIEKVAEYCCKMRGSASTLDLHILFHELKTMQGTNRKLLEKLLARGGGWPEDVPKGGGQPPRQGEEADTHSEAACDPALGAAAQSGAATLDGGSQWEDMETFDGKESEEMVELSTVQAL